MPRVKGFRYVKRVHSRGHWYGYFDTGTKDAKGKRIYSAIGRMDDPSFGGRYAAMLGRRTARARIESELKVPALVGLYQKGEKYRALAPNSKRAYDLYLARFAQALPSAPANGVERRDIVLLLDKMADTPAAANLLLGAVGALYDWARDRGHVTNDPCKDIARMTVGEHDPWPDHLVEEALGADDALVRLAVHLLFFTAQRISDVGKMRWSDVQLLETGQSRIAVVQQKTGKALDIPAHSRLKAVLDATPRNGLLILANPDGTSIKASLIRTRLKAWTTARGHDVVAHGLRKNAVNALLEAGCSVAETAAISGQSLQMVEHYAKKRAQGRLASAAILKWERNG